MSAPSDGANLPPIVQAGDPVLRTKAAPVTRSELEAPEFRHLVDTMISVMRHAPGVGLAAPQIGVPKQVIVLEDREEFVSRVSAESLEERGRSVWPLTVVVNPTLRLIETEKATFLEGCLSVEGYVALVRRAVEVEVTGLDATGPEVRERVWRVRGWPARIFQHEVDHLNGTLYVDRMHSRSLIAPRETARWTGKTTKEIAAALGVALDMP